MEQWNSDGGTVLVEQCWWNSDCRTVRLNSGTVWWNSGTVLVEQWNSDGGTVEQCSWNSGTVFVEQCYGTVLVEQWSSGTVKVEQFGGTMK